MRSTTNDRSIASWLDKERRRVSGINVAPSRGGITSKALSSGWGEYGLGLARPFPQLDDDDLRGNAGKSHVGDWEMKLLALGRDCRRLEGLPHPPCVRSAVGVRRRAYIAN